MNIETITLWGEEWLTRHRWGSIHPKPVPRANCWYDPGAITAVEEDVVDLNIRWNPKDFIIDHPEGPLTLHADYGTGLLCSVRNFSFGEYRLTAKLPQGNYLWPAFWLYTATPHRPEEIDIAEWYSGNTGYKAMGGMCGKTFVGWDIRSCLHTGTDVKLDPQPARFPKLDVFNTDPSHNYLTYGFVWKPDYMDFSIEGITVRVITDKKTLAHFAKYPEVMVIINNHIDGRFYKNFVLNEMPSFTILDFLYVPL